MTVREVKEMGITIDGFVRTLPNAAGQWCITREGMQFQLSHPHHTGAVISILLQPLPPRRIASLTLPVTQVELQFEGLNTAQVSQFLQRFDLYYHKGGG
ncbi:MAG TPA: hypothetical protein VIS52_05175 [Motiliproteus sp.]